MFIVFIISMVFCSKFVTVLSHPASDIPQQDFTSFLNRRALNSEIGFYISVYLGFPGGSDGKNNPPAVQETWVLSLGWEDSTGEGTAT